LLPLTPTLSQRARGQNPRLQADGFSLDKSQLQLGFDQHERIEKGRQVALHREPDDFQVNLEITMRKGVAHFISVNQGQVGVLAYKFWKQSTDVVTGRCDDFKVPDHSVLYQLVG